VDCIVALPPKARPFQKQSSPIRSIAAGDAGQIFGTIGSNTHRDSLPLDKPQLYSVECVQSLRSGGRHTALDRLVLYARGNKEHLQPLMPRLAIGDNYLGVRDTDKYTEPRYSSDKVTSRRKIWQDEQSRRGSGCSLCLTLMLTERRRNPIQDILASTRSDPSISSDTFLYLGLGYAHFYLL
jgi:hypothetical protein